DHVTGAHVTALGAAALSHTDTAERGVVETSMVVGKFEVRFERRRVVAESDSEVFVEKIWRIADELPRIHFVFRIPDRLKFTHRLHELGAEHFGPQLPALVRRRARRSRNLHSG